MTKIIPEDTRIAVLTTLCFFAERYQENVNSARPTLYTLYACGCVDEYGLDDDEIETIVRELVALGHVKNDAGVYWPTDKGKAALTSYNTRRRPLTVVK